MEVIKIKLLNNSWVDILLCLRDGEIPFESERGPRAVCFLFLVARLLPALPVWGLGGCLVFPVLGSPQQQPGPGSDHWPPLLVAGGGQVSLSVTSHLTFRSFSPAKLSPDIIWYSPIMYLNFLFYYHMSGRGPWSWRVSSRWCSWSRSRYTLPLWVNSFERAKGTWGIFKVFEAKKLLYSINKKTLTKHSIFSKPSPCL